MDFLFMYLTYVSPIIPPLDNDDNDDVDDIDDFWVLESLLAGELEARQGFVGFSMITELPTRLGRRLTSVIRVILIFE